MQFTGIANNLSCANYTGTDKTGSTGSGTSGTGSSGTGATGTGATGTGGGVSSSCPGVSDSINPLIGNLFSVKFCSVNSVLVWVAQFLLSIIAMSALVATIYGGFQYVTSAQTGGEKSTASGKRTITNAVIGLVIAVLAYTIVSIVNNTLPKNGTAGTSVTTSGSPVDIYLSTIGQAKNPVVHLC